MLHRYLATIFFFSFCATCIPHTAGKSLNNGARSSAFIENKGQIIDQNNKPNPGVLYLLNTPGLNVQLRNSGFSYDVYTATGYKLQAAKNSLKHEACGLKPEACSLNYHRINFDLLNTNPNPSIVTSGPSPDYLNYYTSGTPSEGVTFVRSFKTVIYKNIYPNIDLEFKTDENHIFKYNFIVRPGGDITDIRIKISGPLTTELNSGRLFMNTAFGGIEESIPECSFSIGNSISESHAEFTCLGKDVYVFIIPHGIPGNATIVIDPIPVRKWATYYGGSDRDGFSFMVVKDRYLYLLGTTYSNDNIATTGAFQTTYGGSLDCMVVKMNAEGQRIWATYYGASGTEYIGGITADNFGHIYFSGTTTSTDSIATPGAFSQNNQGGGDAFLAKFSTEGIRIWATYYGGPSIEVGSGCTTDGNGNIYLCGQTLSSTGIATSGSHQQVKSTNFDGFMVKFDSTGSRLWGTYYGGDHGDMARNIATDGNGNVILVGETSSTTNIATLGAFQQVLGNAPGSFDDFFIARFNTNGVRQWGTYYGGNDDDFGDKVLIGSDDNIYFSGQTESVNNIASPGAFQTIHSPGDEDACVAEFSMAGSRIWGTYYGGNHGSYDNNICLGNNNVIFLCGDTPSDSNIATPNSYLSHYKGNEDAFLVKFSSTGQPIWGTYYGDTAFDAAWCVGTSADTIYIAGQTMSLQNIVTPGCYQPAYGGGPMDGFIVKFIDCNGPDTATQITGPQSICAPYTGVLYYTDFINGATGYSWTVPPGVTIVSGQNTSAISVDFGPGATSGQITVAGTNTCSAGEPYLLFIHIGDRMVPTITGNDTACTGGTETYTTEAGKSVYQWFVSPGGTVTGGGTFSDNFVNVLWNNTGSQYIQVTYTDTNGCNAYVTNLPVIVSTGLVAGITISASTNPVCSGDAVTFTAIPVNGGSSPAYQWKVNGINAGTGISTCTYTPASGDLVSCILTSSNTGCIINNPATSDTITMIVNPFLPVSVTISTPENPFCQGTTVTFTATPSNGGTTPFYQWKVNGGNAGTDSPVYSYIPGNGDVVSCVMNSNVLCPAGNPATSNSITMIENTNVTVSVSITASANPICSGTTVTFQAFPVNGGSTPVYQWKVNGIIAGANNPVYSYVPANGDIITSILTSNAVCASGNPATSNAVTMIVNPNLPVSISISASANPVCMGTSVTFLANPVNPGTSPLYQWKVNGNNAGANNTTYSYTPTNGDVLTCIITSNVLCPTGNPATSNPVAMIVNPVLPVSLSITASNNPVCSGIPVTFTAIPINGGNSPVFQWKVNGLNAGTNSSAYIYNPSPGDNIYCILNSSIQCPTGNPATSNTIIMNVETSPVVTLTRCNDSITTTNAKPFKLKGGIPLWGTYSGPGVTNGIFSPAIAGVGTKIITYSYTNSGLCSASSSLQFVIRNPSFVICGTGLTDIRDNKVYQTVQIGSQCWMAEDLNYGTEIISTQHQRDNCIPEKYTVHSSLFTDHSIYQWDELMQYDETVSTQGLCPPGWHIPSEADWNILFTNYTNNGFAASPLKYSGFSGFNALLSGAGYLNKSWDFQGFATLFWSSTAHSPLKAWAHGMNDPVPSVSLYPSLRSNAFSVRCLKD